MKKNISSLSHRITILLALSGLFLMSSSLFAQHTYYISKSLGSDTRTATQAQSKSAPWAHVPGMNGATSNAASYSPVAGDNFILLGGDTWVASDLGTEIDGSGTSSSPIYIGVDKTWYSGSSWTRPVWTCGGSACSGTVNKRNYFVVFGAYVTLDNIEFTGLYESSANNALYYQSYNQGDIVENCYFHGWSHQSGLSSDTGVAVSFGNNEGYSSIGSGIHDSVIDGSDTSNDMLQAVAGNPNFIYDNVFQYVTNEFQNGVSIVYNNYFGPLVTSFAPGAHENALQIAGVDNNETHQFVYNNVITGSNCSVCGGAVKLWLNQDAVPSGTVSYAFNNVIYNNAPGNYVDLGGHTAVNNGVWYFFNNTVECGSDSNTSGCASDAGGTSGMSMTFYDINNHWITGGTPAIQCAYITCPAATTNLTQSVSTANSQGYTSGSTYAFSPTNPSGSSVGAGTNEQSICTAITALNVAAGMACQNTTAYACAYNTSNHTVSCPNDTEMVRPTTGAWNIGAYQFTSTTPPTPPTLLTATPD